MHGSDYVDAQYIAVPVELFDALEENLRARGGGVYDQTCRLMRRSTATAAGRGDCLCELELGRVPCLLQRRNLAMHGQNRASSCTENLVQHDPNQRC